MGKVTRLCDDDVGLHVLGCWVDILGTNCKRDCVRKAQLLKREESRGGIEQRSFCFATSRRPAGPNRPTHMCAQTADSL